MTRPTSLLVVYPWSDSPGGYCPLHSFDLLPCWTGCIPTRVAFAQIAHDLEHYWLVVYGRKP